MGKAAGPVQEEGGPTRRCRRGQDGVVREQGPRKRCLWGRTRASLRRITLRNRELHPLVGALGRARKSEL